MTNAFTLRPGLKLHSCACDTEVIVIRAPAQAAPKLTCGGSPMSTEQVTTEQRVPLAADTDEGTLLGKRYADTQGTLELLCTHAGAGSLAIDGVALVLRAAKPLPASD
jgi:hypothetical protein